jgi:hypothetical protein
MNHIDTQLKQTLAKMLPETLYFNTGSQRLCWISKQSVCGTYVLDTELLHICWLVEETLVNFRKYHDNLCQICEPARTTPMIPDEYVKMLLHVTYEQRIIALAKTLNIEIV